MIKMLIIILIEKLHNKTFKFKNIIKVFKIQ